MGAPARTVDRFDPFQSNDDAVGTLSARRNTPLTGGDQSLVLEPVTPSSDEVLQVPTGATRAVVHGTEPGLALSSEEACASTGLVSQALEVPVRPIPRTSIRRLSRPNVRQHFLVLQKWEGVVLVRQEDSMVVRLTDLTGGEADEEAEIPLDEVFPEDLDLVEPGAVFYWSVGYVDDATRGRTRSSSIRFRRLPEWTRQELELARQEAEAKGKDLGWI